MQNTERYTLCQDGKVRDSANNIVEDEALSTLKHIDISADTKNIDLDQCLSLESVTFLPESQARVINSFRNCSALEKIEIPASVELINIEAFTYCTSLKRITFAPGSQLEQIATSAFENCSKLESIEIPGNVRSIQPYAFEGCNQLNSITVPLRFIGMNESFWSNIGIDIKQTAVTCSDPIYNQILNASLTSHLPETLESTVAKAYIYALSLSSNENKTEVLAELLAKVANDEYIECLAYAVKELKLTAIEIPAHITKIDNNAFIFCDYLKTVTFAKNSQLKTIGDGAFQSCIGLEDIVIPASVEVIEEGAFHSCESLENVTFAEDARLKSMGQLAFSGCKFRSIDTPDSLEIIEDAVFYNCRELESITVPARFMIEGFWYDKGIDIGEIEVKCNDPVYNQILNGSLTSHLPETLESAVAKAYIYALSQSSYENKTEVLAKLLAKVANDKLECLSYAVKELKLTEITIPASTEIIGNNTFYECASLKSISFASGSQLKSIGNYAFHFCSGIKTIEIPASVESICDLAFYGCESLESISYAPGSQLKRIGKDAFDACFALKTIEIPSRVQSIGVRAFSSCLSLESITVPLRFMLEDMSFWDSIGINRIKTEVKCNDPVYKQILNGSLTPTDLPDTLESAVAKAYIFALSLSSNENKTEVLAELLAKVTNDEYIQCLSYAVETLKLTAIEIPAHITKIDNDAFIFCDYLKTVTFAKNSQLKTIGDGAFQSCIGLEDIVIPASVEVIEEGAFHSCESLENLTFTEDARLKSIGQLAFYGCKFRSIDIPDSVEIIEDAVFYNCRELDSVTCTENSQLKTIGDGVFQDCDKLEKLTVPIKVIDKVYTDWMSMQIDLKQTEIVCSDPIYNLILENKSLESILPNIQDKYTEDIDGDILSGYMRALDKSDDEYKSNILSVLVDKVPIDERENIFTAIIKSESAEATKLSLLKVLGSNIYKNNLPGLSKIASSLAYEVYMRRDSDLIAELSQIGLSLNSMYAADMIELREEDKSIEFKNIYVSGTNEQSLLHVLLPFARGYSGIATDNTCEATTELSDALIDRKSSICRELNRLDKYLKEVIDDVNNAEVESKCQSLAVQSNHYKNSSIYQLRTVGLAREIQSIRSFPKDVQALLNINSGGNLYSIVLCPDEDQDPYLRSGKTAVCSFERHKYLRGEELKTDGQDSPFSTTLKEELEKIVPRKKETLKSKIIKDVQEMQNDVVEEMLGNIKEPAVDERLLVNLQKEYAPVDTEASIVQCEKDKKMVTKDMTTLAFMRLTQIYNAPQPLNRDFMNEDKKNDALTAITKLIEARINTLKEEQQRPVDMKQEAMRQMETITAVKEVYMKYMEIDEEEATSRFEAVFINEAKIDLTDIDGILNILHSEEDWSFYSANEIFYEHLYKLKDNQTIDHEKAASIDIAAQFLIGKVNVYCVANELTRSNFGIILDKNENIRNGCIEAIKHALTNAESVEHAICQFIVENQDSFHMQGLEESKLEDIISSFNKQYILIKNERYLDEFFIYESVACPKMIQYGANVCFAYSELLMLNQTDEKDKQFHTDRAGEFADVCKTSAKDGTLPKYDLREKLGITKEMEVKISLLSDMPIREYYSILRRVLHLPEQEREHFKAHSDVLKTIYTCIDNMSLDEYQSFMNKITDDKDIELSSLDKKLISAFPNKAHSDTYIQAKDSSSDTRDYKPKR